MYITHLYTYVLYSIYITYHVCYSLLWSTHIQYKNIFNYSIGINDVIKLYSWLRIFYFKIFKLQFTIITIPFKHD